MFADPMAAEVAAATEGTQLVRVNSEGTSDQYAPDEEGYAFTLPDNVESRLRYRKQGAAFVAEFRVANRDFKIPAEHSLETATKKVIAHFSQKGRKLTRSPAAANMLTSLTTLYNVKAACASDRGEDAHAAMWGIAPWKLGIKCGLLVPFDVFVGNSVLGIPDSNDVIEVPVENVRRARMWADVLDGFREAWNRKDKQTVPPSAHLSVPLPPKMQASVAPGFVPPDSMV